MEPEFAQRTYDGYKCGYIIRTSRRVISSMKNSYVRYPFLSSYYFMDGNRCIIREGKQTRIIGHF